MWVHLMEGVIQPAGLKLRISPDARNFMALSLWCIVTFVQFSGDQLILYPLAIYYAWAIWRDQRSVVPLLVKGWVVLLFPLWCIISPLWAVAPADAVKHSVYLTLTMLICVQVAATMSPRLIMHAILAATGTIGIINLLYSFAHGAWESGIFPQKNVLGANMAILWTVALATSLDSGTSKLIRISAVLLTILSLAMVIISNSATAMLSLVGTGALNIAGYLFLYGGVLRASRIAAICFLLSGIFSLGAAVLPGNETSPVDAVLSAFGKDSTLTGRTVLWKYAEDQIEETPYLGVGEGGFWRYDESPLVQKIHEDFHKKRFAHLDFHNSFYQIAVHQGLIGIALVGIAFLWAIFNVFRGALIIASLPHIYFLSQSLSVLLRTLSEADFLKPFVLFHMIFWIGAFAAVRVIGQRNSQGEARYRDIEGV